MTDQARRELLPQTGDLNRWLAKVLQKSSTQNQAQVQLLPKSGSERRVFRLRRDCGSAILIDAGAEAKPYLQRLQKLSKMLTRMGLRVAKIEEINFKNNYAIVEDLGENSYARCLRSRNLKDCRVLFENAMQSLLRLAGNQPQNACSTENNALLPAFTEQRFVEQVSTFFDVFLFAPNNDALVRADDTSPIVSLSSWQNIWQKLYRDAQFQSDEIAIVLGDVHTENLFALAGSEQNLCAFIDFQDAHFAPRCYDVVSMLEDGLWTMPHAWQKEMWQEYCDAHKSLQQEHLSAARHYQLCAMHRDIRMIGILYRLLYERGRERYGAWLARVARNCEKRLRQEPRFADLQKFIERVAPDWQQRIESESENAPQIADESTNESRLRASMQNHLALKSLT